MAYFHKSDMKQTLVCIVCDWLISNSTSKDDVERWMSKNSRHARNTESGYKGFLCNCDDVFSIHYKNRCNIILGAGVFFFFRNRRKQNIPLKKSLPRIRSDFTNFVSQNCISRKLVPFTPGMNEKFKQHPVFV